MRLEPHVKAVNDPKSVKDTLRIIAEAKTQLRKFEFALAAAEGEILRLSGRYKDEEGF